MSGTFSNSIFRVYKNESSEYKSSLFDLIDGDYETKQTKGLAYLFKLSPEFLRLFLSIEEIMESIKKNLSDQDFYLFLKSDFLRIDAEMISHGSEKIRRDITITFFHESRKTLVLIIEAKNIKNTNDRFIEEQLQKYLDPSNFQGDENAIKIAIALTKYKQKFPSGNVTSIMWKDVILALHNTIETSVDSTKKQLLRDYYNFITGVDRHMNFYEKEILSVPAGKTFDVITKYHIHACPDTASYNYRDPLFITFRQRKGGVMDKLYKIKDVVILAPENKSVLKDLADSTEEYKERLLQYIEDRKNGHGFKSNDTYKFYILSEEEHISLEHRPKPEKNNAGGWYYTLTEMLSGKEVVRTEGKQ